MRTVIGIIIGMALILAFQKIMNDGSEQTTEKQPVMTDKSASTENEISKDFLDFYTRFHEDSLFQIEHITFPLEGLPINADTLTMKMQEFRWTKEEWRMHKLPDEQNIDMDKKWVKLKDGLIVEMIQLNESKMAMQRRFAKTSRGWAMIYYAAPNFAMPE